MAEAKQQYSSALRNLERISDEIHRHRSRRQSARHGEDGIKLPLDVMMGIVTDWTVGVVVSDVTLKC